MGRLHGDLEVLQCYLLYVLSLDDLGYVVLVEREFSNFVMFWDFKLKGYPAFEPF